MTLSDCSKEKLLPTMYDNFENNSSPKVCFLLTHVPDPRTNKRIACFKEQGFSTSVICTRRKIQDIYEPEFQDVPHYIYNINLPSAKHLVKRAIMSQHFKSIAIKKLKEIKPDIIYTEGLDLLLIAREYKKRNTVKIYFECADLRENFIKKSTSFVPKMVTSILLHEEKVAFKSVNYLVVTSPKFYDVHFKELIDKEHMLYIPNAPDLSAFNDYKRKKDGKFTVGFIGGVRYIRQMKMLVDAAEIAGCNVLFAGAGGNSEDFIQIKNYCEKKEFVNFSGKYNYQQDISKLYGEVDCVYAVYDASNPNVCIALPNKLYESIVCELPIIVAKNTYLSEIVTELGVGVSIDYLSTDELAEQLHKLMYDKSFYTEICNNCHSVNMKNNL